MGVCFNVLGRFEVVRDGQPVTIRGGKPRMLLVVLLLNANQPVSVERLVEALWGDRPPGAARQTVHYFVHQLRRALGSGASDGVLVTRSGGYVLRVGPGELDAERFERLLRSARSTRAAGDPEAALDGFEAAEALWRGPALADFAHAPFAQPEAARLEELRLSAIEERMAAAVELGREDGLIGELEALVRAFPLRERLRVLLVGALWRAGRHAAATAAYEATRRRFSEELGVEPGHELRRLGEALAAGAAPETPARRDGVDGERLARDRDREERRLVTVLVVGLTEPAGDEDVDPEDVRARRSATLADVHGAVDRFGGVLHTAIGGTALAVFGVAHAREDDPERAVRAALALRDLAADAAYGVRIGVDTGEAVVSSHLGAPGELPWTGGDLTPGISGSVVDTAAALQAAAPPGGVLVSAATHRATERAIDFAPARHAGAAWRPVAPRSRIGVAVEAAAGPEAPLVERAGELELLRGLLDRVRAELEPQLVTLIGTPGIGKTRLVRELGRLVEDDRDLIYWRQGRSLPYGEGGRGVTFWALGEIVKAHAGILDTDDAATADAKLGRAVAAALGDAPDAGLVERHLRPLVRAEPDGATEPPPAPQSAAPQSAHEGATAARARFLEALAADRPLVVVFEDLQWADDRLLDFIEELPDRVGPVPLLVAATARPELLERRPGWGGGKRNAITVSLTPLSARGAAELLRSLAAARCPRRLPDQLVELLLGKAGGNPLYLEEYVRMLGDLQLGAGAAGTAPGTAPGTAAGTGGCGLPIPETVQQLITARIDTLPPADKRLLTDLAVIGEQGWAGLLAALGGTGRDEVVAGLGRLERRELLRRTRSASVAGEDEYVFRHTLIREVAYGLLLRGERAAKHQQVAEWLAALSPDRMGDRAELLAHHLRVAVELARAAGRPVGDLAARACEALWSAGDRAYGLGVFEVAAGHYEEALPLCADGDPRRPELLFRLGRARYASGFGGREELAAARDGFVAAGDRDRAARVEVLLGLHALARGRAEAADAHVARALDHLDPDGPPTRSTAMALNTRAFLLLARGPDAAGFAAADRALRTARALDQPDLIAGALCPIGASRLMLGDLGGVDDLERGIAMLEEARKLQDAAQWWGVLATGLWTAGLLDRCAAVVADGRARTAGWGLTPMLSRFGVVTAGLDWAAGRWDAVLAFADEFFERFAACDTQRVVEPRVRLPRATVLLARGDVDGALADTAAAVSLVGGAGVPVLTEQALAAHGRVLLAAGDRDGAAAALARAVDGQCRRPATAVVMPNQLLLADDLADARGEDLGEDPGRAVPAGRLDAVQASPWRDAAAAYLAGDRRRAATLYERMGVPAAAAEARLRAARRLRAAGKPGEAAAERRAATAFLRATGAAAGAGEAEERDDPDAE